MSRVPPGMAEAEEPLQPTVDRETPAELSPETIHALDELISKEDVPEGIATEPPAHVPATSSAGPEFSDLLDLGIPSETGGITSTPIDDALVASLPMATRATTSPILQQAPYSPREIEGDEVINATFAPATPVSPSPAADDPLDLLEEEAPSRPPPTTVPGHLREAPPPSSTRFVPPLRAAEPSPFPRAEGFMGGPLDMPRCPVEEKAGSVEAARWLIANRQFESALRLMSGDGAAVSSEVHLLRFRCLVALKRYDEAGKEAVHISPQGDAAPFEVRLLAAQLPFLLSKDDAVPALGMIQELAQKLCDPSTPGATGSRSYASEQSLSERLQVLRTLSHVSLAAGHGRVAVGEIQRALTALEKVDAVSEGARKIIELERLRLHSLLGRHHVSAGNTASAEEAFANARKCSGQEDAITHRLDKGLLAVASGAYSMAKEHFAEAATASRARLAEFKGETCPDKLVDEAVTAENNLAVCRLYTKELREGIKGLEALVRQNAKLFLRSSVAQNLSDLYTFLPDAVHRRTVLKEVAKAFRLEDLGPKSFEASSA